VGVEYLNWDLGALTAFVGECGRRSLKCYQLGLDQPTPALLKKDWVKIWNILEEVASWLSITQYPFFKYLLFLI
jgi:hypothetical protein